MAYFAQSTDPNSKKTRSVDSLKIVHWNCNSIKNKKELLGKYLYRYEPHVVSLNEIKLDIYEANLLLRFDEYHSVVKCRNHSGTRGGGVAILVRTDIEYNRVNYFDNLDIELVAIKCSLHGKNVNILSFYNPPSSSIESDLWARLQSSKDDFILCGDLNCRSSVLGSIGNNRNGELLEDIVLENDFVVLNESTPTYNRNGY
jgi:exonuclease III